MKNIWMLILANLRKNKGQTVSLFVFVLIAAMFLNIGLVVFIGVGSFFDERAEDLHAEHFTAIYSNIDSIEAQTRYIEDYPGVNEIDIQKTIGGMGTYSMNDTNRIAYLYIAQMDENKKIGAPSIIGESLPLTGDAIYIPYFMMLIGDYKIGDIFQLTVLGTDMYFTIAGGLEELLFGAQSNTIHRVYVSEEKFSELREQFPDGVNTLLSARFDNKDDAILLASDFSKEFSTEGLDFLVTIDGAKMSRTMTPILVAVIITVFAMILLIVSLIVIRFRINNSIDESMTNIGTLKAIGYGNGQIISSIVGQFGITAIVGCVLGIVLSYAVIPLIIDALTPMFALHWSPGFDMILVTISLLVVFFAVITTALASAWKINRLHPLIALRGGITTHSFRKNPFPLDKSYGPLALLFALKQLVRDKKQAVAICIIIAAVTMASVAGIVVNYTMNEGRDSFTRTLLGETPDAILMIKKGGDGEAFKERLMENPDVRKTFGYQFPENLIVDETAIMVNVVEDCSLLEGNMLMEGRYPKHDNEIALGPVLLKLIGKKVGDTIVVKNGDIQKDFLVIGIVQFVNNNGLNGIITGSGISQVQPDFRFASYSVYLIDGSNTDEFIETIKNADGDILEDTLDMGEQASSMLDGMSGAFAAVAIGIVMITTLVVTMTLYMVIKTAIQRRRRELGIQKALGFTTLQLMNQITWNMIPIILLGTTIGAVAGYYGFNPMFAALLGSAGIVKIDVSVPLNQTLLIWFALVTLAYAVSMLIALKIRKISAYGLVSE